MPSFVVHMTLPLLFLLALRRVDARKVWILWPLTILPDLDYFFGLHRAALTNVFVLLPLAGLLAWSLRRGERSRAEWSGAALAYLGSHFAMDMLSGGIVPLWPLSDYTVCYYAQIVIETATNAPSVDVGSCSHEGVPTVAPYYPWLSTTDTAMVAFVLPAGLAMAAWNAWKYRQAARGERAASR